MFLFLHTEWYDDMKHFEFPNFERVLIWNRFRLRILRICNVQPTATCNRINTGRSFISCRHWASRTITPS